ncbi:DUF58 domain-containing protein [Candidatus Babeliales bacterium]|nr:DUF58 domain-containing protein [Candidatus Babeliales bacterium]MBP9843552.1 DUF58 domain-containing protein [Candidatus Babeliales bacterium]
MLSPEILKKIHEIKFRTRRVMNGTLVGGHVTKRKGSGFEFDQIRAYNYGDDIRFMDWNSSARTGKLLVRQYLEEKNRTIVLCLDVSASTFFAGKQGLTSDVMQQVIAILSCVGEFEQDNIGLLLFSDQVEKFIAPSRGYKHTMYLMETIFSYKPVYKKTDINVVCRYLIDTFRSEAAVVIVSDFIAEGFEQSLKQLVCKREVVAIRCIDEIMKKLPPVGYVWGQDPETQATFLLHFSGQQSADLQKKLENRIALQDQLLRRCNIDCLDIAIDTNFLKTLILFFKRRMAVP